jgi:hypothetical protein
MEPDRERAAHEAVHGRGERLMGALGRVLRGFAAAILLVALVVAVPVFLVRAVGNPWPGRDAIELRDEQEILLGVLAAAAWVAWARFVAAVIHELVVQSRQLRLDRTPAMSPAHPGGLAAPPPATAGGGIGLFAARLVALVLAVIPATQATPSGSGPLPFRPAPLATAAAQPAQLPESPARPSAWASSARPVVEVGSNDSLFRIAERHLGDRARWREILELNTDRLQPDGARLTTPSSLRRGWTLVLPADARTPAIDPTVATAGPERGVRAPGPDGETTHVVVQGESYWEIAESQLRIELGRPPSAAETSTRAQELIRTNAPLLGRADPAMLHPGDELVAAEPPAHVDASTATHIVEAGESYWEIAESHLQVKLGRPASEAEVLDATTALVEVNAPLFGYEDPRLLHPGDEVVLPAAAWPAPVVADEAAEAPTTTAAERTDTTATDPPATDPPTTDPPTTEPPTSEPPATAAPHAPPTTEPPPTTSPTPSSDAPATSVDAAAPGTAETGHPPATTGGALGPSRGEAVPVTAPPDTTEPDYGGLLGADTDGERSPVVPIGLGGAVFVAGGALAIVDARRRAALRRAQAHDRLRDLATNPTEVRLRSLGAAERLMRLDLVLRALAVALREQHSQPLLVLVHRDGSVTTSLTAPAMPGAPWIAADDGWWTLPGSVDYEELAALARSSGLPCPALVQIGTSGGADLYVDLEAAGVLTVDGPAAAGASIIDALALALAVSPFATGATLTMIGVDERIAEARPDIQFGFDAALATATARSMLGTIGAATAMGASTFGLRSRSTVERWEPVVVVLGSGVDPTAELQDLARPGGHGVALVASGPTTGGLTLEHTATGWMLQPAALEVQPVGVDTGDVVEVVEMLDEAERELVVPAEPLDANIEPVEADRFEDREWELLVRTLGAVQVHDGAGTAARFERSKAQELVCWLASHRSNATRTAARTALWETDVRDATFANVVSDARRNLARLAAPPEGEEWIGRTLTESLPLHELVVSDADLLADRVTAARGQPAAVATALLRPGLALITDVPFAGTGYLWPDAEGIVTELVLLGITAAIEMAQHCLTTGDVEGVFWATGQGLRMLPGHEELVALRMRAHARVGDLAAVRAEWGSYERALAADPWSDAEPAPKLVDLRRELLGPATAERG